MKKCKIQGLDCPNCARILEREINSLDCVKSAKIDFVKSVIFFDAEDYDKSLKEIVKLTSQLEPSAKIIDDSKTKNVDKKIIIDLLLLIAGIGVGLWTILISMPSFVFWSLYVLSALLMGYKTYYKALRLLLKKNINENFLITISIIGATCLGEYMEGLMVIGLYSIGKVLESIALNRSKKSIENI